MPSQISGQLPLKYYFSKSASGSSSQPREGIQSTRKRKIDKVEPQQRADTQDKGKGKGKDISTASSSRVAEKSSRSTKKARASGAEGVKEQQGKVSAPHIQASGSRTIPTSSETLTSPVRDTTDLTGLPTPRRRTPRTVYPASHLPSPPVTIMKPANAIVPTSDNARKRVRRGKVAEGTSHIPVHAQLPSALQLPTPRTPSRRTTGKEVFDGSSPLSSLSSGPVSSNALVPTNQDLPSSDPFVVPTSPVVTPLSPSRRLQIPLPIPPSTNGNDNRDSPLANDVVFKVPTAPRSPSKTSFSESNGCVVESSQWEEKEQNILCPATPISNRLSKNRLVPPIHISGDDPVETSQLTEMELRIPSSPMSARRSMASALQVTTGLRAVTSPLLHTLHYIPPVEREEDIVPTSQLNEEKEVTSPPRVKRWPDDFLSGSGSSVTPSKEARYADPGIENDPSRGEVVPETPQRDRSCRNTPGSTPMSHHTSLSPLSEKKRGGVPFARPLAVLPDTPAKTAGSDQVANMQWELLCETQSEDYLPRNPPPLKSLIDTILESETARTQSPPLPLLAHPSARVEHDIHYDSSQTEPESSQWRVPTQGQITGAPVVDSSRTESESSQWEVPAQGRVASCVTDSSQTEPESSQWRVPTQGHTEMQATGSSQTEPESSQWHVPTQGYAADKDLTSLQTEPDFPTGFLQDGHTTEVAAPLLIEESQTQSKSARKPTQSPGRIADQRPDDSQAEAELSQDARDADERVLSSRRSSSTSSARARSTYAPTIDLDSQVLQDTREGRSTAADVWRRLNAVRRSMLARYGGDPDAVSESQISDSPFSIPSDLGDDSQRVDLTGSQNAFVSQANRYLAMMLDDEDENQD